MTRVYVDMVADLFHCGHVQFLRQARALGDTLIVGIHADADVMTYKRRPVMTMDERLCVVTACRYVDEAVPNAPLIIDAEWLERHRIDIVAHGDDFGTDLQQRWYPLVSALGILRLIPYTDGISTSTILERVRVECASDETRGGASA